MQIKLTEINLNSLILKHYTKYCICIKESLPFVSKQDIPEDTLVQLEGAREGIAIERLFKLLTLVYTRHKNYVCGYFKIGKSYFGKLST